MSIEKRIERVEAILDARGLDWDHPRVEEDHFAGANKMVADEPAKEPKPGHRAGPMPDPGQGYRLLSKDPPEELARGDEFWFQAKWYRSAWGDAYIEDQEKSLWYRRKIEQPEPAWEPKAGDWVRVTKPQKQDRGDDPIWLATMDQYDGKVFQVKELIRLYQWPSVTCDGINCAFKIDWLSPAEPPEPEYREPVLPADCFMGCEFSDKGEKWASGCLAGWSFKSGWIANNGVCWAHARIKKDA